MKFLVVLDLVSTLILPASLLFLVINIIMAVTLKQETSIIVLAAIGINVGVQVLPFVLRGDLVYMLWFIIYTILGVPIFYVVLPLYSFWNMDDFGWGATRQVDEGSMAGADCSKNASSTVDAFDEEEGISCSTCDKEDGTLGTRAGGGLNDGGRVKINEDEMDETLAAELDG